MIDEKVKGREITAAPQPVAKPGPVIDLMEALRGPCHTQDFGIDLPLHHSLRAPRFIGVILANPAMVTIAF
jgi:hypothetical protein